MEFPFSAPLTRALVTELRDEAEQNERKALCGFAKGAYRAKAQALSDAAKRLEAILSRASQPPEMCKCPIERCAELDNKPHAGYCTAEPLSRASGPEPLREKTLRLRHALKAILEIGKRDMSNPKYDGYFEEADLAIKSFDALAAPIPVLQEQSESEENKR